MTSPPTLEKSARSPEYPGSSRDIVDAWSKVLKTTEKMLKNKACLGHHGRDVAVVDGRDVHDPAQLLRHSSRRATVGLVACAKLKEVITQDQNRE